MNYLRLLQLRRGYMMPDDGAGTGGVGAPGDAGTDAAPAEGADGGEGEKPKDEHKQLTQAEIDAIVEKRLARERKDQEAKLEKARKDGMTEGEKLAKMSANERAEADRKAQEDAIAKREADITRRELRAEAMEELATKGLPRDLSEILVYTDADACKASIAAVEKVFRDAVQQAVNERLKGKEPPPAGGGEASPMASFRAAAGLPPEK